MNQKDQDGMFQGAGRMVRLASDGSFSSPNGGLFTELVRGVVLEGNLGIWGWTHCLS